MPPYDPDNDPAVGCLAWAFWIILGILFIVWIVSSLTSNDPTGRCEREPGPNGITITTCERD